MKELLEEINKGVENVGKITDNLTESSEERQAQLTARHAADAVSQFKLPQLIRPIIALTLLAATIAIMVVSMFGVIVPVAIVSGIDALMMVAISFYFGSRGFEKIATNKVNAAIKIESIKAETAQKREALEIKLDEKQRRAELRASRKAARRSR